MNIEYKNCLLALAASYGSRSWDDPVRNIDAHNIERLVDTAISEAVALYQPTSILRPDPCVTREQFETAIAKLTGCRVGDGMLEVSDNRTYKNEHVQFLWRCYNMRGKK